jgi:hypothetical protein
MGNRGSDEGEEQTPFGCRSTERARKEMGELVLAFVDLERKREEFVLLDERAGSLIEQLRNASHELLRDRGQDRTRETSKKVEGKVELVSHRGLAKKKEQQG